MAGHLERHRRHLTRCQEAYWAQRVSTCRHQILEGRPAAGIIRKRIPMAIKIEHGPLHSESDMADLTRAIYGGSTPHGSPECLVRPPGHEYPISGHNYVERGVYQPASDARQLGALAKARYVSNHLLTCVNIYSEPAHDWQDGVCSRCGLKVQPTHWRKESNGHIGVGVLNAVKGYLYRAAEDDFDWIGDTPLMSYDLLNWVVRQQLVITVKIEDAELELVDDVNQYAADCIKLAMDSFAKSLARSALDFVRWMCSIGWAPFQVHIHADRNIYKRTTEMAIGFTPVPAEHNTFKEPAPMLPPDARLPHRFTDKVAKHRAKMAKKAKKAAKLKGEPGVVVAVDEAETFAGMFDLEGAPMPAPTLTTEMLKDAINTTPSRFKR